MLRNKNKIASMYIEECMKDILVAMLLFVTIMCENGHCMANNQALWTNALEYAESHTSGRLKVTQLKSHDLNNPNNAIRQMLVAALTKDNLKKLARHNIKHLERLDSTKSTSRFSLPCNNNTKSILEKTQDPNSQVDDKLLSPMVKLMKNTIDNFLKLEQITISLRTVNTSNGSRRQLQLTAQITRQEFLKLQGYKPKSNLDEFGNGINLCLIISYDADSNSFTIHHFWDIQEHRPRHFTLK